MSNQPKPIVQTNRNGQKITVYNGKGGASVVIEPKTDKYIKQD